MTTRRGGIPLCRIPGAAKRAKRDLPAKMPMQGRQVLRHACPRGGATGMLLPPVQVTAVAAVSPVGYPRSALPDAKVLSVFQKHPGPAGLRRRREGRGRQVGQLICPHWVRFGSGIARLAAVAGAADVEGLLHGAQVFPAAVCKDGSIPGFRPGLSCLCSPACSAFLSCVRSSVFIGGYSAQVCGRGLL